jgi:glycosyltransferase involved in cell wall biosynthesis
MRNRVEQTAKPRVLLSGHLPPPMGGMAAFYQALLSSSLPERVNLCFVQTSTQERALANSGSVTAANLLSAVQDGARFARAALRHRPQITHIATAHGLSFLKHSVCVMIAWLLGSRVLLHPHCAFSAFYADRSAPWRWYVRQIIRLCDGIVALSHEWEQLRSVTPNCRVHALPNAIDLTPYQEIAQEQMARSLNGSSPRVLYLGYVGRAKGTYDLIEAAKELRSTEQGIVFDLVGDELNPGERALLRQRIEEAGLSHRVHLREAVSGAEKLACFRAADLLVYPSYYEGMPMAVLEAMACALPIVATRVGGLPDLVVDGVNGLLVEPGNPQQLAAAIRRLATNEELRRGMRMHSYQLVCEQYGMEQRMEQLVDIYQAVLAMGR